MKERFLMVESSLEHISMLILVGRQLIPGQGRGPGFSFSCCRNLRVPVTRPCFEGVGGFFLSIKIVLFELGGPSSREIAEFGDPPSFFVDFCNVICALKQCYLRLGLRIIRQKS